MDYQEKLDRLLKLSSTQRMNIDKLRIRGQLSEEQYQELLTELKELKSLNKITVTSKGKLDNGYPSVYQIVDNTENIISDIMYQIDEIKVIEQDEQGIEYETTYPEYDFTTHDIKQKLYIKIYNNLEVLFTLNPNRFANKENELLINMLIRRTSELNNAKISHIDFNIDLPYRTSDMKIDYKRDYGFADNGKKSKGIKKLHYRKINISKLRELIMYDKLNERLDKKLNKNDDSYLSRNYVKQLKAKGINITRIELRLLKASQVGLFLKNYKTALKDFSVKYRSYNENKPFGKPITLYGVDKSKNRKSFNRELNQQLKLKADEIKALPYVTDEMIKNTTV